MSERPMLLDGGVARDVLTAARMLREGGVVAVPTDTVYGLSASIFKPAAIERIFEIKGRASDAAVPILLATAADLGILVSDVPRIAWTLIDRFWPGRLTLVLPVKSTVSRSITGGGHTVAVRVPGGRTTLELLQSLGEPIVGTSANRHGHPPALTAHDVQQQLGAELEAILADDAAIGSGAASTVVEVSEKECLVHRIGAVSLDDIRSTLGPTVPLRR